MIAVAARQAAAQEEGCSRMFADTAYTVNLILTAVILQMESSGRGGKRAGVGPARGAACVRGRDA